MVPRLSFLGVFLAIFLSAVINSFLPQTSGAQVGGGGVGGTPLKVITPVPVGHCFASAGSSTAEDGGICASGTTGLTGMTANQVPLANSATTINSSFNLGTGVQTFLSAPTSANLLAALTDETGTGVAVFGTSPTITTPTISGNLTTNITGSTQCVHANSSGVLSGTGVDCGSGGGGSGLSGMTATQIPIAATSSTVTSSIAFGTTGTSVILESDGSGNAKAPVNTTTGTFSGQVTSTVTTGTAPLVVGSTTNVANLNASSLGGATFAAPGTIGGTTPSAGHFTTLSATSTPTFPLTHQQVLMGNSSDQATATSLSQDIGCADTGACTVTGFQTKAIDSASPSDAQVLMWKNSASKWTPTNLSQDIGCISTGPCTVTGLRTNPVDAGTPNNGDVLTWHTSGTPAWAPAAPSGGANGLSGLTAGQLGVAGSSNTLTSSVATGFTGSGTFVPQTTSGLLSPTVLPLATSSAFGGVKVDGTTITAAGGVISAVGGGGSLTVTDGTHSVASTTTLTQGNCFVVGGSAGSATVGLSAPDRTSAGSATVGAADMCGQINFSSTGTATIPAISSTVFAAGMTVLLNNISSGNVVVSSTPTINGCTTPIAAGSWWALTSNGTSLDCFSAAASSATAANPTATIGTTAVNGSASTYMRSDAAPAIAQCSSSVFGACKVDGTTITASGGVITATGVSSGVASVASGSSDIAVIGTGSPATGAVTVSRSVPLRSQAGGSIVAADGGKIVYNTGGAGITLPVHTTTGFGAGFATTVMTDATAAMITVTTDSINGNTTEPLGIKQGIGIVGDGTNLYKGLLGMPEVVASSVLVSSSGRVPLWQAGTSSQLVRGDGVLGTLGTAAAVNTGTSGATIPLLNGNWTESGNVTFSGTILASGLSSGTCASGLSLDSGNNVVKITCPAGSGLSGMTTGQVGVAGGATSITSSVPFGVTGNSTLVETTSGGLITSSLIPPTTLATGTSASLTAPKQYYVCTGTCTVTPPVPAVGYEFCVLNDDNVATVITLAALGSGAMYEATARTGYGSAGTGTLVSTGAVGDEMCIVGRDATHYLTLRSNGTWTAS